jgi:CubicO group peptidase (beta-lactamase class C family)
MKTIAPFLVVVGLLVGVETTNGQDSGFQPIPDLAPALDTYFIRAAAFGFSGVVLVAEGGEVKLNKGYGLADRAAGTMLDAESPLHIGSLGKQFTAAAILRLETDGRLSTDDRLERFFPDAPEDKRRITLHQLLSHTSGLPYLPTRSFTEDRSRAEVMDEMLELPLQFEPGERYAYSNPGFTLLAGVIEQASGETFEQFLNRQIFLPAGLIHTGFVEDRARWAGSTIRAYSSEDDDGESLEAMRLLPKAVGAGTVVSTAEDLFRWDRALQTDLVLPEPARRKLFAPTAVMAERQHYGYGWMITGTSDGETLIHHAGDLGGYNADFRRYVERDLVLIVISNARHGGRGYRTAATNALANLRIGSPLRLPPIVSVDAAHDMSTFAGEYEVPSRGRMHVRPTGQTLRIGGFGEDVLLTLGGADDSARARSRTLSQRAEMIATALAVQDVEPLRVHLHRSLSFEGTSQWLLAATASLTDSLGTFQGVTSLGTAVISPTVARSYFELDFERGSYPVMYGWNEDKINHFDAEYEVPMQVTFYPVGDTRFAWHDLFTGQTILATFELERRPTLQLRGGDLQVDGVRLGGNPHEGENAQTHSPRVIAEGVW